MSGGVVYFVGHVREARHWARENDIDPRRMVFLCSADSARHLRGRRLGPEDRVIEGYGDFPGRYEITHELKIISVLSER